MYSMRHNAYIPAGYRWPAPQPVDRDATVILTPHQVLRSIEAKEGPQPAWKIPGSGLSKPSIEQVRKLAAIACGYRIAAKRDFAKAWLTHCLAPAEQSRPYASAFGLPVADARSVERRFADEGVVSPDSLSCPF